jgi:HTH-type transcriptional regulator, glycine betaine synthesis regulator
VTPPSADDRRPSAGQADPDGGPRPSAGLADRTELAVADVIGRLIEFWGFKRPMGRIWALLYLSPDPLGAAELAEELKMSPGAVSLTLGELARWGVVKKTWRPGERRDFYEAETSIYKLVQRVLRERELVLVREVRDALDAAAAALMSGGRSGRDPGAFEFKRQRLDRLRELARIGEGLLSSLAAGEAVDPSAIREATGTEH